LSDTMGVWVREMGAASLVVPCGSVPHKMVRCGATGRSLGRRVLPQACSIQTHSLTSTGLPCAKCLLIASI